MRPLLFYCQITENLHLPTWLYVISTLVICYSATAKYCSPFPQPNYFYWLPTLNFSAPTHVCDSPSHVSSLIRRSGTSRGRPNSWSSLCSWLSPFSVSQPYKANPVSTGTDTRSSPPIAEVQPWGKEACRFPLDSTCVAGSQTTAKVRVRGGRRFCPWLLHRRISLIVLLLFSCAVQTLHAASTVPSHAAPLSEAFYSWEMSIVIDRLSNYCHYLLTSYSAQFIFLLLATLAVGKNLGILHVSVNLDRLFYLVANSFSFLNRMCLLLSSSNYFKKAIIVIASTSILLESRASLTWENLALLTIIMGLVSQFDFSAPALPSTDQSPHSTPLSASECFNSPAESLESAPSHSEPILNPTYQPSDGIWIEPPSSTVDSSPAQPRDNPSIKWDHTHMADHRCHESRGRSPNQAAAAPLTPTVANPQTSSTASTATPAMPTLLPLAPIQPDSSATASFRTPQLSPSTPSSASEPLLAESSESASSHSKSLLNPTYQPSDEIRTQLSSSAIDSLPAQLRDNPSIKWNSTHEADHHCRECHGPPTRAESATTAAVTLTNTSRASVDSQPAQPKADHRCRESHGAPTTASTAAKNIAERRRSGKKRRGKPRGNRASQPSTPLPVAETAAAASDPSTSGPSKSGQSRQGQARSEPAVTSDSDTRYTLFAYLCAPIPFAHRASSHPGSYAFVLVGSGKILGTFSGSVERALYLPPARDAWRDHVATAIDSRFSWPLRVQGGWDASGPLAARAAVFNLMDLVSVARYNPDTCDEDERRLRFEPGGSWAENNWDLFEMHRYYEEEPKGFDHLVIIEPKLEEVPRALETKILELCPFWMEQDTGPWEPEQERPSLTWERRNYGTEHDTGEYNCRFIQIATKQAQAHAERSAKVAGEDYNFLLDFENVTFDMDLLAKNQEFQRCVELLDAQDYPEEGWEERLDHEEELAWLAEEDSY